ncbi:MAG: cell division protein ZapD [Burkholderiaceae bacterium]
MILYEYPLNEGLRALLRIEDVLERFEHFRNGDTTHDHAQAVALMFDLVDLFTRTDCRTELLSHLDRQRRALSQYRDSPDVSGEALERMLLELYRCHERVGAASMHPAQAIRDNEWLMAVRSRILLPGGAADYDMPSFWAWQNGSLERRRADLRRWMEPFEPMAESLRLVLRLLRESGKPMSLLASDGSCQHSLGGQSYQMTQLRIDPALKAVPEISANKYLLWIRFNDLDDRVRARASTRRIPFELTLCNL